MYWPRRKKVKFTRGLFFIRFLNLIQMNFIITDIVHLLSIWNIQIYMKNILHITNIFIIYLSMNFCCWLNGTIVCSPWDVVLTWASSGDLVTFSTRFNCRIDVLDIFFRNAKSIATGTMAISTHGNTIAVDNKESTIVFSSCIIVSINCGKKTSAVKYII